MKDNKFQKQVIVLLTEIIILVVGIIWQNKQIDNFEMPIVNPIAYEKVLMSNIREQIPSNGYVFVNNTVYDELIAEIETEVKLSKLNMQEEVLCLKHLQRRYSDHVIRVSTFIYDSCYNNQASYELDKQFYQIKNNTDFILGFEHSQFTSTALDSLHFINNVSTRYCEIRHLMNCIFNVDSVTYRLTKVKELLQDSVVKRCPLLYGEVNRLPLCLYAKHSDWIRNNFRWNSSTQYIKNLESYLDVYGSSAKERYSKEFYISNNGLSVCWGNSLNNEQIDILKNLVNNMKYVVRSNVFLAKYELTQKEWKSIMGYNPSYHKGDSKPVEQVLLREINTFLLKLSQVTKLPFRLPTINEWKIAADDGGQYGGNNLNQSDWYLGNSNNITHDVGQRIPNRSGIYDMYGNVRELCIDNLSGNHMPACGGSYGAASNRCTSNSVVRYSTSYVSAYIGLRIAISSQ